LRDAWASTFEARGSRHDHSTALRHHRALLAIAARSELIVEAPAGKANETVDVLLVFDPGGELKIVRGFTFTKSKKKK
jgi:hypothetical protein